MKTTFLDFEQPVAELEARIDELRFVQDDSAVDISDEIERLSKKSAQLTKNCTLAFLPGRPRRWRGIRSAPIRWIIFKPSLLTFMNCTATAPLPTTLQLLADWRA